MTVVLKTGKLAVLAKGDRVLTKHQVKALKTLINYVSNDECENFGGEKDHIWRSIRVLYRRIYGKDALAKLENSSGEQNA